ncbi:hypothetical protein [Butyrivibrio sp. VCB2006]|uniref:hypothetical protein n=1 Tax=Butyrivibrio sp. VCB2006 TaxID=1280679 RepID=UPI0003F56CB2|nr:hypothetical protein [Butyrivibrio sp. VCB2006]
MNKFINDLERKFGKYAIPNLSMYIVALYAIGYVLVGFAPSSLNLPYYLSLNPERILHGQVWRLVSWLIIPPTAVSLLVIITLIFYYFVGSNMERTIGTFRYNLFIFSGIILMIIGAFAAYGIYSIFWPLQAAEVMLYTSSYFNVYYIQQIVFLAFAILYPNVQVLLMFIIPIKVKYMGIAYGALLVWEGVSGLINHNYSIFFAIGSQLLNLFLFYLQLGKLFRFKPKEVKRRTEFQKNAKIMPRGVTRHKCAVCGRTEETNPDLEFRFCSKCNGNYEYCQDHLFTHQHVN